MNKPISKELTVGDLTDSSWEFFNDEGRLGVIKFDTNGNIYNYDHHHERTWQLTTDNTLIVKDGDNQISARYNMKWRDYFGKWKMIGATREVGWKHYLNEL